MFLNQELVQNCPYHINKLQKKDQQFHRKQQQKMF